MLATVRHEVALFRPHSASAKRVGRDISRRHASTSSTPNRPRTAIFFPGQGVQRVGMTTTWLEAFPRTVKPMLDEIDHTLGFKLSETIAEGTNAALNATENSQPAIMATSLMILRVLEKEYGFRTDERVDYTLGHSLGEFAALVTGGYLDFPDALSLVHQRGEVFARASRDAAKHSGGDVGMVALVCENEGHLRALVDAIGEFTGLSASGSKHDSLEEVPVQQVVIANINSKNQIVLSGNIEKIQTLLAHLRQFGGHDPRHVRLNSESPFHSPLMKPAQDFMKKALNLPSARTGKDLINWPGSMPCVSNVSGRPFTSRENLKDLLARQSTETVKWWDSVRYLDQEAGVRRWIGIGPGKVGRNLVGKEVGMKGKVKGGGVWGITSPQEAEEVMKALDETEHSDDSMPTPPAASANRGSTDGAKMHRIQEEVVMHKYSFNPTIVQRLWPPPQRLAGIDKLTQAIDEKTAHRGEFQHLSYTTAAMFRPASA